MSSDITQGHRNNLLHPKKEQKEQKELKMLPEKLLSMEAPAWIRLGSYLTRDLRGGRGLWTLLEFLLASRWSLQGSEPLWHVKLCCGESGGSLSTLVSNRSSAGCGRERCPGPCYYLEYTIHRISIWILVS